MGRNHLPDASSVEYEGLESFPYHPRAEDEAYDDAKQKDLDEPSFWIDSYRSLVVEYRKLPIPEHPIHCPGRQGGP